ncbi:MAG: hypothetical protein CSA75_04345, partial [Sorangium cellulosum]
MRLNQLATWISFLILTMLALWGCSRVDQRFDLITVLDVTPREVDLGDRIEIIGLDFPEGKAATIAFKGDLYRPGKPVEKNVSIVVDQVPSASSSRISFTLSRGLHDRFAGVGPDAIHTTFRGDVIVSFPSTASQG